MNLTSPIVRRWIEDARRNPEAFWDRAARGEVISAFVVLKHGHAPSLELRAALIETVRHELGAIAVIGELNFVSGLPKTRSGKIMRRVLKAVTLARDPGDITTIEDEGSVEEARLAWERMRTEIGRH